MPRWAQRLANPLIAPDWGRTMIIGEHMGIDIQAGVHPLGTDRLVVVQHSHPIHSTRFIDLYRQLGRLDLEQSVACWSAPDHVW